MVFDPSRDDRRVAVILLMLVVSKMSAKFST
jgi:hypothetical protein